MRHPVDQIPEDQDDQTVVAQVLDGDVDAFERLFTKYRGHVTAIVRRHVPGDRVAEIVQDAFVRAFQSLAGWRADATFRRWLATIAVRTCYDFWRRQYRSREIPMSRLSEAHREWLENSLSNKSRDDWETLENYNLGHPRFRPGALGRDRRHRRGHQARRALRPPRA